MSPEFRDYSLRWEQIDWDNNIIHIRGKGRKNRKLSMTDNVKTALQNLGPQRRGKVFKATHWQSFRNVTDKLFNQGLDPKSQDDRRHRVSMHTLRHYAVLATRDLFLVAKLLGHSDIQTTQVYAHLLKDSKKKAMAKINNIYQDITSPTNSDVININSRR